MANIPITEDELTELLRSKIAQGTPYRPEDSMSQLASEEARRLARLMMASEQMYEALKERAASGCKGECTAECDLHTVGCENAYSALAAAEKGTTNG